jgi:5-epi-alpha-selinene synthase
MERDRKDVISKEPFVIPEIPCPVPSLINPSLEQVQEHCLAWAQHFQLAKTQKEREAIRSIAELGARIAPRAELEETCIGADWLIWAFLYDDAFEETADGLQPESMLRSHEHMLAMLQKPLDASPQTLLEEVGVDIFGRAARLTSPLWQRRFFQCHVDWFAAERQEAHYRRKGVIPERRSYLSNRERSVGTFACIHLAQLCAHFEVPPQIYEGRYYQDIVQAALHLIILYNDIYSVGKELMHGEVNNLILIVQHEEGCSFGEALQRVYAMIEPQTQHFQQLVDVFPSHTPVVNQRMRTHLMDIAYLVSGILDWQRITPRYQQTVVERS